MFEDDPARSFALTHLFCRDGVGRSARIHISMAFQKTDSGRTVTRGGRATLEKRASKRVGHLANDVWQVFTRDGWAASSAGVDSSAAGERQHGGGRTVGGANLPNFVKVSRGDC